MQHSKASTTTDVYTQPLEPEVRTTVNSIYRQLSGKGARKSSPPKPKTMLPEPGATPPSAAAEVKIVARVA